MATPRKATAPKPRRIAPVQEPEKKVVGRFTALANEATKDFVPLDPYVIGEEDGILPDIVITEPVETERIVAMTMLLEHGIKNLSPQDFQPLLMAVCGEAYERVWSELLRGKHFKVTAAFLQDVQTHFYGQRPQGSNGASDVPGGSQG